MDGARGQRFCLLHTPPASQPALGHVVYVHPFAEEMNASRRMAALNARALARAGSAAPARASAIVPIQPSNTRRRPDASSP